MDEEFRKQEVSETKENCTGIEGRRKKKTLKDRFEDPATENGSGNEIDGIDNHLNSGVVRPEEGEKKEEKILSCENILHGGFFENQDVCLLHRDNQGVDESGRREDKIDQGTLELLEKFFKERFGNGEKYDNIIKEFLQWTEKETKARKLQHFSQRGEYPSPQRASSVTLTKSQVKEPSNESRKGKLDPSKVSLFNCDIKYKNDNPKIHLLDVGFEREPSDLRKRLTKSVTRDEFSDLKRLRKLIREQSSTYCRAILQLDSKAGHLSFAVVTDTITPDIKIRGRVSGAFDMDQVVVEVQNKRPISNDGLPCSRGKIVGESHNVSKYLCQMV